jgi:hypothetical protein
MIAIAMTPRFNRCQTEASRVPRLAARLHDGPLDRSGKGADAAPRESPAEVLLRDTRPDDLTPCEALDLVYRLKALAT